MQSVQEPTQDQPNTANNGSLKQIVHLSKIIVIGACALLLTAYITYGLSELFSAFLRAIYVDTPTQ